jgi:alpha-L-fucosidase
MLTALTLLLAAVPALQTPVKETAVRETDGQRAARMAWFREARFGIFLHWGLYTTAGGQWDGQRVNDCGEWIQNFGNIPTSRYKELVPRFQPDQYDPKAWAQLFHDAGARYVVMTTKHHDGFCLWDSARVEDWDVGATPYKRDVVTPLAEALRQRGLKFGAYYSILDWRHPDYGARPKFNDYASGETNMTRYVESYMLPQLQELLTKAKPDYLWFDGGWDACYTHAMGVQVDDYVRSLSPQIIVNNRVDKGFTGMDGRTAQGDFRGDCGTPEQEIPENGFGPGVDWETCYSMMKIPGKWTWGWRSDVTEWSTPRQIVDLLVECASKGGNLLLNVGPTPQGTIPTEAAEPLRAAGAWIARHSEAIYGTQASPFPGKLEFGRVTQRGATLYLFLNDARAGQTIVLPGLTTKIRGSELLGGAGGGDCAFGSRADEGIVILPMELKPDGLRTVVRVDLEDVPQVVKLRLRAKDGQLTLLATEAAIEGKLLRVEQHAGGSNLGYWLDPKDSASWPVVLEPGTWQLRARLACANASAGSRIHVRLDGQSVANYTVAGTGEGWHNYSEVVLGEVSVNTTKDATANDHTVQLTADTKSGEAVVNVERLVWVKR